MICKSTLGEFLTFKNGKTSPERSDDNAIAVYGSNGVIGYAQESNNPKNTIVIGRVGSYCGCIHYSHKDCWVSDNAIACHAKNPDESLFWKHYLIFLNLNNHKGGSGQPLLNQTTLNAIEATVPESSTQRVLIGKMLELFDSKIASNIAMNQTLEKIAQRIFKSWFIDFDPVKANAEGVPFNGLSPEIQALFPNKLVDSKTEFGLIPEGWNPSSIGVEFDVTMGQSPPGSSYNEEKVGVKFFQGRRDFSFRFPSERVYTTDPKRMAKSDDTLISVRAPVGDINMAMDDCCIGRGLGALRHKKDLTSYTYYLMQSIKPVFDKFESNGTVFGSINQNELKAIQYVAPDIKVLEEFEKVVRGLDKKIRENLLQNLNLTSIKEKILPRLITGKIQLSDANQELKEAV